MRTIIEIPDNMLHALDIAREKQNCSRAAIIREAISAFLERNKHQTNLNQSFGTWKDQKKDGLEYQEKLREEWSSQ
jgi:metal-responsive CopG/Arc/MetJ family transcriptional regulator